MDAGFLDVGAAGRRFEVVVVGFSAARSPVIILVISSPSRLKLWVVYWENIEGAREERCPLEYMLVGLRGVWRNAEGSRPGGLLVSGALEISSGSEYSIMIEERSARSSMVSSYWSRPLLASTPSVGLSASGCMVDGSISFPSASLVFVRR